MKLQLSEVDGKTLSRQRDGLLEENQKLKQEYSNLITKINELKTSNLKVSKNLEDATDQYDVLTNLNADLENTMETMQARTELFILFHWCGWRDGVSYSSWKDNTVL